MTPKERRDRLFKTSRPHIRPLEQKDMGCLWAAYKYGSFNLPAELSQEQFHQQIAPTIQSISHFIVEDDNHKFKDKRGPVGMIAVATDGERCEPLVKMFAWASPRNTLRSHVAFYQWVRSTKDGSKYENRVDAKDKLFKRLVDYGVVAARKVQIIYTPKARK